MIPKFPHIDIHSHDSLRSNCAVINIYPGEEMLAGVYYSVGIHPWNTLDADENMLLQLKTMSCDNRVVAIGETGLDALKGPSIEVQQNLFVKHIEISEQLSKPLLIHAVKTIDRIIALKREIKPCQPWIIHGFRGKPEQASQLLNHGFYLSLGQKFNPETAAMIPADRLFYETDESAQSIASIVAEINSYRKNETYR